MRAWPLVAQYAATILLAAAATAAAFALRGFVAAPSLTLFYVLAVVAAAVSFGWGPSLAATVLGVVAYDFFFTRPYYSLAISSPTDITDAALLLVIAAIVSGLAAESRRRAQTAVAAARKAEALQSLAHVVVVSRPAGEVAQAAARALNRIFEAPAIVLTERDGDLQLAGRAGAEAIGEDDRQAAVTSAATEMATRGGDYPTELARFDFWPFRSAAGAPLLVGLDFSEADDGRPRDVAATVELIGGYLSASRPAVAPAHGR